MGERAGATQRGASPYAPHALGRAGETVAERHYRESGYRVLERNLHTEACEVDLVCEAPDGTLVFCEVKTRRPGTRGLEDALLAVSRARRRRLVRAALCYMAVHGGVERPCRFDVVAVGVGADGTPRVELHVPDAFGCDSGW